MYYSYCLLSLEATCTRNVVVVVVDVMVAVLVVVVVVAGRSLMALAASASYKPHIRSIFQHQQIIMNEQINHHHH